VFLTVSRLSSLPATNPQPSGTSLICEDKAAINRIACRTEPETI
jgi:hypothetical protein